MKKIHFVALSFLATLPLKAAADDQVRFYVAGGASARGSNFSIGGGTKVDALELSSIDLGTVDGANSARFVGLSLVQNATPVNDFNLLFRVGFGKATTTFADGSTASRQGFSDGVFFGLGAQYQLNSHLAFRGELDRITYAASADGSLAGVTYPLTISALYSF